jgi:hypothetical protein
MDAAQLQYITRQVNIYFGSLILILGVIGDAMNAIIFANIKTGPTQNFCAPYFFAIAMVDLVCLLIGLLSKILASGFGIDPTVSSIAFCKFRIFFVNTVPLISTSLTCLTAITQFLVTSPLAHYRTKVSWRFVRWTILFTVLFWFLHGLPYVLLYTIRLSPTTNIPVCNSINFVLNQYTTWMTFNILIFIVPVLILAIFGYLTYRNITSSNRVVLDQRRTAGQRIEQLLTVVSGICYIFGWFLYLCHYYR